MEWYGPLTILPAIGLLILSTSNFIVSLNEEVTGLQKNETRDIEIITLKLAQLKKLGIANAFLYASSLFFLLAGIMKALFALDSLFNSLMLLGVFAATIAIVFLLIHSLKSVYIRQKHLQL